MRLITHTVGRIIYALLYVINLLLFFCIFVGNTILCPLASQKIHNIELSLLPPDLMKLIQKSTNTNNNITATPDNNIEYQWFSAACNFSNVATILQTIYLTIDKNCLQLNSNAFDIFIVGASSEITLFTSNECLLLSSWLPSSIDQIRLYFIGPELPLENLNGIFQTEKIKTFYIRSTYETFCENIVTDSIMEIFPSLIICFNCGFSEYNKADNNPWQLALNEIMEKNKNIPIAFTSYSSYESCMDNLVIEQISKQNNCYLEIIAKNLINSCRDLRPYRNMQCENDITDEIYYYNGYLNIVVVRNLTKNTKNIFISN